MCRCALLIASCILLAPQVSASRALLRVLAETEQQRDGLPILAIHPDEERVCSALERGFSGRFLRLFHWQQEFLSRREGVTPEPAYLLLSNNPGGFPRFGFYLSDEDKRHAGYVDLRDRRLSGRFGAIDQMFPHELAHVIVQQLAGEPEAVFTQVHAIGVTTDRVTAFQEGFAEHLQILAVDDPDAHPETRALASDHGAWQRVRNRVTEYRREITARWAPATRRRTTFPLWFGNAEQTMRYHAVKDNLFAYEAEIPEALLRGGRSYDAYLLQHVLPGTPTAPRKTPLRALASEGAVATFFHSWAMHSALQHRYRNAEFYAAFGAEAADVSPVENVYLKLFLALFEHKPRDTRELILAYRATFPDEAALVDEVVHANFGVRQLPEAAPLWLASSDFEVGTSLYDQFRGARRPHVFDLNAASIVDLTTVSGVSPVSARAIVDAAPLAVIDDVARIEGVTEDAVMHLRAMAGAMQARQDAVDAVEQELSLDLRTILMPYVVRGVGAVCVAMLLGALLFRRLVRSSAWRCALRGLGAASVGLIAAWVLEAPPALVAVAFPVLLWGVPEALWKLARWRDVRSAGRALVGWVVATLPAALLVQPLF